MSDTTIATIIDGVIALAVIVGAIVLLALHSIDKSLGIALIGVGVTLVGGSAKTLLALRVPPQ